MTRPFKIAQLKHIFLFFALIISVHSHAQEIPNVMFGYIDARSLSIEQILANPKLSSKEPGCEVIGYELRITRRGYDYYGPYIINGQALTENVKRLMKDLDVVQGKMYFENIRVKYKGKEMTLRGEYVLRYYR